MTQDPETKRNIVQIYLDRVERFQDRPALYRKTGDGYKGMSWKEWAEAVRCCALGLWALGVGKGDRVGILSENRPEWTVADLGILSLGAVVVPIYPTLSLEDIAYILQNAQVEILFLSNPEHFQRLQPLREKNLPLKKTVLFDGSPQGPSVLALRALLESGRLAGLNHSELYGGQVEKVSPEDLATILYTSGTTGPPKGVMLTHSNFICNYLGSKEKIKISDADVALSFLPLNHVFERLAGYYFMTFCGAAIAYAESMQTVGEDIREVRPTVAAAVPRFYEKIYNKILETVETLPPLRKKIFHWAVKIGTRVSRARMAKGPLSRSLKWKYALAHRLVFRKLKESLGGRIRFFISGSAPLNPQIAEFFHAADILILEGYGLTETSPVIAVNSEEEFRFGTVGKPLSNCKVKIAEDGEILTQGPCVMKGYFKNEEATREAVRDGWFYTGDIGTFDGEGFLKITDRKKDILKTSGGKMIAPQNIERHVLTDPLFLQAVLLGDKRHYLVALIVPHREQILHFAEEAGLAHLKWEELLKHPKVYEFVDGRLEEKMKGFASFEQIKYFALLPQELTIETGELTPTLKVKRKVVQEKYRDLIDGLYTTPPKRERVG